eukprot:2436477-Prymnesium_polylepis.1
MHGCPGVRSWASGDACDPPGSGGSKAMPPFLGGRCRMPRGTVTSTASALKLASWPSCSVTIRGLRAATETRRAGLTHVGMRG